jgi:hypothetical protein
MRVTLDHPAVVTGTWENGHVRRELVRVSANFDIAECSTEEAPRSFTVRDLHTDLRKTFRTVDKKQFKRWTGDEPAHSFGPDSQLMRSLYNGKSLDFGAIGALVSDEITRVQKTSQYREIENTSRRPLKRELQGGLDTLEVSCMKAPLLKNWQWLGPDVDQEVADWRDRISSILANIILVDGIPHMRTFEPCHRVRHATTLSGRIGDVDAHLTSLYSTKPDRTSVDPETGLENLGKNALMIGSHYFAATEFEEAVAFAEESGWGVGRRQHEIDVHDESAVQFDYFEMEMVRHARMVHDLAGNMIANIRREDGADTYHGRPVNAAMMRTYLDAMRTAIVAWQSNREATDNLAEPFEALVEQVLHWEKARLTKPTFDLSDQLSSFKLREDMAEIKLSPVMGATPSCA